MIDTGNVFLFLLALPYCYVLARVVTMAYFHVKYDYHKRFLKGMEGRE